MQPRQLSSPLHAQLFTATKEYWSEACHLMPPLSQPEHVSHPQPLSVTHHYKAKAFSWSPSPVCDKTATSNRENGRKISLTLNLSLDLPHSLAKLIKLKNLSTLHLCRAFVL